VQYDEFIESVQERTGVVEEEAEALTHETLRVLAERITAGEAEDLASQLPEQLQEDLWPTTEQAESFGPDEFARRVAERAGTDDDEARAAEKAVLETLREAVTPGEFDDVLSQLGRDYAELIGASG
jgi:uncharacterized protein (DUF2267 family)